MMTTTEIDLSAETTDTMVNEKQTFLSNENQAAAPASGLTGWLPSFMTGGNKMAATAGASDWIGRRRQGIRSWREFIKTDKFKLPSGPAVAGRRLVTNIEHFQSNYFCVFIVLVVYCILTSPLLLIGLGVMFGASYYVRKRSADGPFKIGTIELSTAYQYAAVALLSFPLFYLAGAGSVIFWVIGASIFFIVVHALLYASEPVPGADFTVEHV